jgi:hypothetical protein
MLLLHAVIGPAALITCDPDLRRSGLVHEDSHHLRAAVWQVTEAEEQAAGIALDDGVALDTAFYDD